MGIPRKGSRKIIVDGRAFRWLRPGRPRMYGDAPSYIRLIVQEDVESPGRPLAVDLQSKHCPVDEDWGTHRAGLLPSDVEKAIRAALREGWDPEERGAAFELGVTLDLTDYRTEG